MITCSSVFRTSGWGEDSRFHHDFDPKHVAKTTQERIQDKSVKVHEKLSHSPWAIDLNPIKNLWQDLHIVLQLPIQPDREDEK